MQNKTTEIETSVASNSKRNTVTRLTNESLEVRCNCANAKKYKMQLLKQDKFNWS